MDEGRAALADDPAPAADPVREDRLLGHEPDQPPRGVRAQAGEDEVEVAHVVEREQHPAVAGHVVGTGVDPVTSRFSGARSAN